MRSKFFTREITGKFLPTKIQFINSQKFEYECMIKNALIILNQLIDLLENNGNFFETLEQSGYTTDFHLYINFFREIAECPSEHNPLDRLSLQALEQINSELKINNNITSKLIIPEFQNQYISIQKKILSIEKLINAFKTEYSIKLRLANYSLKLGLSIAFNIDFLSQEIVRIQRLHKNHNNTEAKGLNTTLSYLTKDECATLNQALEQMEGYKGILTQLTGYNILKLKAGYSNLDYLQKYLYNNLSGCLSLWEAAFKILTHYLETTSKYASVYKKEIKKLTKNINRLNANGHPNLNHNLLRDIQFSKNDWEMFCFPRSDFENDILEQGDSNSIDSEISSLSFT
ncbi:MAG: hypothetical protein H0U70_04325 [Tatlockia sp.]|nr:hypothetical protein [Tatlockia sp.]